MPFVISSSLNAETTTGVGVGSGVGVDGSGVAVGTGAGTAFATGALVGTGGCWRLQALSATTRIKTQQKMRASRMCCISSSSMAGMYNAHSATSKYDV